MRHVKDGEGHEYIELTDQQVRGARLGRPVLYMLIGVVVGTNVSIGAIYMAY